MICKDVYFSVSPPLGQKYELSLGLGEKNIEKRKKGEGKEKRKKGMGREKGGRGKGKMGRGKGKGG